MNSEFYAVRHSKDDESYIDDKFDAPLTRDGILLAHKTGAKLNCEIHDKADSIDIVTSAKKHTIETGEIIAEELRDVDIDFSCDPRINELYQGAIHDVDNLSYRQKADGLRRSWECFTHKFKNGDIDYRFGDPQGDYTLGSFILAPYGENEREYLSRVYEFMVDVALKSGAKKVVVAHGATATVFQEVARSYETGLDIDRAAHRHLEHAEFARIAFNDADLCRKALADKITEMRG